MLAVAQHREGSRERLPPRALGPYRIVETLESGALDAVYLARVDGPRGFQRRVALRVVDASDRERARELYEAARAAGSVVHPSFMAVLDVGESDGRAWVATEYLFGESAREILRHAERAAVPVPWAIATRIVADAADALAAMHAVRGPRGEALVHGSLTPRSVMVTYAGTTKLKPAFSPRRIDARDLAYFPPDGSPLAGARADVFALATMLWELCAGRHLEVWDAGARRNLPSLPSLGTGVPESIDTIVQRALGNVAGAPCATARELARALRGALVVEGMVVEEHDIGRYVQSRFAERYAERVALLDDGDDEPTEVFRYDMIGSMFEPAPDTERELPPLDEDDDAVDRTMPFRRRAPALASYVKAQPVIVLGPAADAPPPAPSPAVPVQPIPVQAVPVPAVPNVVAAPAKTKRASRWPLVAAAMIVLELTGVAVFIARDRRFFDRASRASAPVASAPIAPVAEPAPSELPSLAPLDPPVALIPSATAASSLPVARRPIAWPRPIAVAPSASVDPFDVPPTGTLTVLCVPGCDQVFDGRRPLGPSPVFKMVTTPGVHHLTLVTTDPPMKKQVDVNVVEDETTVVREEMK